MLIIVPTPLHPSGVITWATRLVSWLAGAGRPAGLLLHGRAEGPLADEIASGVRVFEHPELPHFDALSGDLTPVIPAYAAAVGEMIRAGEPVVVSPNLHGDCYGAIAPLTQSIPGRIRVLGWAHSDNRYDARVLTHFESMIHGFVGVSEVLRDQLVHALPTRTNDLVRIPYGVHMGGVAPAVSDDRENPGPIRLVYTGRLDDEQKRSSALVSMSRSLSARGVRHELRVLGDGPSRATLQAASAGDGCIRWFGTRSAETVREGLAWADAFVLPSRYEGLSVSMLEAMACGCAPIVSRVRSGAGEAVRGGETGLIVEIGPDASAEQTGHAFAEVIAQTSRSQLLAMGRTASGVAATRYSLDRHGERVAALIDRALASRDRSWPAARPAAFQGMDNRTGGTRGSGSTPGDAPRRMREALTELGSKRIALHGAGRHTRDLGPVLASVAASHEHIEIIGFCDDDPSRHGTLLWNWPVFAPSDAASLGVETVVISTHLHEQAVWERRRVYLDQGIEVVPLYRRA